MKSSTSVNEIPRFVCFVVINPRVLTANRVDLAFCFFPIYPPPPRALFWPDGDDTLPGMSWGLLFRLQRPRGQMLGLPGEQLYTVGGCNTVFESRNKREKRWMSNGRRTVLKEKTGRSEFPSKQVNLYINRRIQCEPLEMRYVPVVSRNSKNSAPCSSAPTHPLPSENDTWSKIVFFINICNIYILYIHITYDLL